MELSTATIVGVSVITGIVGFILGIIAKLIVLLLP